MRPAREALPSVGPKGALLADRAEPDPPLVVIDRRQKEGRQR